MNTINANEANSTTAPVEATLSDVLPDFHLAPLLRRVGAGAVVLSGVIYLLQGFDDIDASLRCWVYLAMMATLLGGGLASRYAFADAVGARLMLTLAVALVPVQFAQVGGMLHALFVDGGDQLPQLLTSARMSSAYVIGAGVATVLFALLVGRFAFAVLARPHAQTLNFAFLLVNSLLWLPPRDSLGGHLVVICLAAIAIGGEWRVFARVPVYRTAEGVTVRLLFLTPAVIAFARLAFYTNSVSGWCAIVGAIATMVLVTARLWRAVEIVRAIAMLALCASWCVYATNGLSVSGEYWPAVIFWPMSIPFMFVGQMRARDDSHLHLYRAYRTMAIATLIVPAMVLLAGGVGYLSKVVVAMVGLTLLLWGMKRKQREPVFGGGVALIAALIAIAVLAVRGVDVTGWVVLAIGGFLLVLAASAVERYGRVLLSLSHSAWHDVKAW